MEKSKADIQIAKDMKLRYDEQLSGLLNKNRQRPSPENLFKKARSNLKFEKSKEKFRKEKRIFSNTEIQEQRQRQAEIEYQKRLKSARTQNKEGRYQGTRTGAVSRGFTKGFNTIRPGGITNALYGRNSQTQFVSGNSSGKRGRPKGSYDSRYAQYGGVYGYRKQLNAQLRLQKLQALQRANISPGQQRVLDNIRATEQYNSMNEEGKVIPNTHGSVDLRFIHQEANDYANIFP